MTIQRQGLSEREYAAHAGISRGAVQKARAAGRLVLHPDGSVDAAASDGRRRQATDPSMQRGRHDASLRPVPEAAVGAVSETLREQGLPAPPAGGGMWYLQARTANGGWEGEESKTGLQKLDGQNVIRGRVHSWRLLGRLVWPNRFADQPSPALKPSFE